LCAACRSPGPQLVGREKLVDARFDRAVFRKTYPYQSFGAYLRTLHELRELVYLFARVSGASLRRDAAHVFRRIENCESLAAGLGAEVVDFHAETDVRLIGTVPCHRFAPRHARKG